MSTVSSLSKFILLLAGSLAYLIGLGWLVIGPFLHGSLWKKKQNTLLVNEIPLTMVAGFIVNFGLLVIFQTLKLSFYVGGALALFGLVCYGVYVIRFHFPKIKHIGTFDRWFGIIFFSLLLIGPVLTIALSDWDARSIWFFHAKMIYTAGSIGLSAGWKDPIVEFSHIDYPELISALAAQVMYLVGFWNEFLPKFSIYLVLLPGVVWLVALARRSFSYLFLILVIPFTFFPWLWNGYMDGLLAFYFFLALLLFDRFIENEQPIDLLSSLACTIFLLYIKNEGNLAALVLLVAFIIYYVFRKQLIRKKIKITIPWKYILFGIVLLIPFVIWGILKQFWGLNNDLGLGSASSFELLKTRLSDGSVKLIADRIFKYINNSLLLLVLLLVSNLLFKRRFIHECTPALIATGLYVLGMAAIYMITPYDLVWHLNTSTVRVMELANGGIYVASYLILNKLEQDPAVIDTSPVSKT